MTIKRFDGQPYSRGFLDTTFTTAERYAEKEKDVVGGIRLAENPTNTVPSCQQRVDEPVALVSVN